MPDAGEGLVGVRVRLSGDLNGNGTVEAGETLTTTTGALPRPSWYTENLRGIPLSQGFSRLAYREHPYALRASGDLKDAERDEMIRRHGYKTLASRE